MKTPFTEHPYPYKHWLLSVILGPLFFTVYGYISNPERNLSALLDGIVLYSMMGLMFSLPALIVYLVIFNVLFKMGISPFMLKMTLNLLAFFGAIITIKVVFDDKGISIAFFYLIAIIVSSFFFHIKPANELDK